MSFNVHLEGKACEHCGRGDGDAWSWDGMTYNLAPMFHRAGFYEAMKNETGGTGTLDEVCLGRGCKRLDRGPMTGAELAPLVRAGLEDMFANPAGYEALAPSNGWGDFAGAVEFTRQLLEACEGHPKAIVRFSG